MLFKLFWLGGGGGSEQIWYDDKFNLRKVRGHSKKNRIGWLRSTRVKLRTVRDQSIEWDRVKGDKVNSKRHLIHDSGSSEKGE